MFRRGREGDCLCPPATCSYNNEQVSQSSTFIRSWKKKKNGVARPNALRGRKCIKRWRWRAISDNQLSPSKGASALTSLCTALYVIRHCFVRHSTVFPHTTAFHHFTGSQFEWPFCFAGMFTSYFSAPQFAAAPLPIPAEETSYLYACSS